MIEQFELQRRLINGGIDLAEFNKWRKTFDHLYEENHAGDSTLVNFKYEGRIRALREAQNVRSLIMSGTHGYLIEIGRYFENNKEYVPGFSPWALSETWRKDETYVQALSRAMWEEHKVYLSGNLFESSKTNETVGISKSSVFLNVLSKVQRRYFAFQQHEPTRDESPIVDNGVHVHVKWIQFDDMTKAEQDIVLEARAIALPTKSPEEVLKRMGQEFIDETIPEMNHL